MATETEAPPFGTNLIPVPEEEKEEFELVPVPDSFRPIKPTPTTTSEKKPKADFKLTPDLVPVGGIRSFSDDELFRKIESDLEYSPNDAELDKFLKYKKRNPNSAVDFIKGAWDAGWSVIGELGAGGKAIASDPIKSLDFFTSEGWERKAANISEGFARATWDLGVLGREFNEMFGRLRDDELREEMQDMKLRQSNPDWRPDGFMGGESYLSKEEKEKMRTTFSTSYIKSRIKDDLEDIADTTNNFQDSADIIKKQFKRKGLAYVEGADKRDYTTSNYIDNVLSDKTKQNWVKDFPDWIKGRERDRWRKSRYLLKVAERARRGDQTILGEFFGKEFDEKFRKIVNPQVATLISYAGGPPEIAAATATRIPRKALTAGSLVTDPLQVAPTVSGKVAEGAGKAAKYTGEKLEKFGEYVTETPARAATVGGLLGAAAAKDLSSISYGAAAGVIEQKIGAIPLAGRALQRTGEAAQAIGEVVGRPGGTEGILKAASRVAPSEETAKRLNQLSVLDPAINLVSDLSKGAGAGAFTGLALTLPSEDAQKIGGGFGGGLAGGFVGAGSTRFLSKGALLKAQQLNDWEQFRKRLSPKQIESIKKYAPDIGQMGQVMNQIRMIEGAITPEGRGNVDYDFLSPAEFEKRFGAARGVVVSGNRVKPEIIINTGWQGPNSMFHEAWHAMKKFAGTLEEVKVAGEGKQEVPVLKPYLEKVQTLLFGQELNGKQVVKGLFDKETILGDFAEQYTKEMTPEQIKTWEQQFSQDPVTKEKFTPEQAEQNKLNYLMEELEAESFRYLMSGSDPRGIASGQRSLKQKFIDHMLLSEHSKTLRGMKKALSSVGITFKGSGQPSDIFLQPDAKGQWRGLTNSPELNAALRDYVRAWEGLQYRTRYIDEVDPSGFQIGGKGVAGSKVVEFQLKKAENDFLRNHFRSSDIIEKNEDGEVLKMPDGSLSLLNEGQIRKLQEDRSSLIREALERTEDPNGMIPEVHKDGGVSFKGVPTARQLDAIDKISNKILTPNQKQVIREVSTMMSDDPGAPLQFLYNAAIGKGKRYSSSLSSSHRVAVPLGFHASKAQNFYFTALDLGAYHNKLKAWADDSKKALHTGGHKMELWNKDVKSFEADLFKYLENHKKGIEGETGLDPDLKVAEQKRNVLNDFFNINKGEEGEGNFNPIAAARRATDPKTGKQKKRAYQSLENLIRSYRLDRVLDEDFGKSLSYSLGKRVPMKSQKDFFERQLQNFMTLPKGEEGARFMPPPAPTTPQFKRFFEGSKVVDSKGEPLVVYSGHGNTELYGTKYNKNKGTSGGFYATEDPSVASSYARGKIGDREFYEDGSEYRFLNKSGNYNKKISQIELTPEQQAKAKKFLKEEAGLDVDKYWEENARYDRDANRARLTGGVKRLSNVFKFMESMGDTAVRYPNETVKFEDKSPSDPNARAMQDLENQGTTRFEDLLNEIGVKWNAFDKKQPGVFPLYLSIKNPLDANKPFPEDVLTALKKSASRERPKLEGEFWTKDLSMKEFVDMIEEGSEFWSTQVPSKAKKILQEFGYDGIKELGNKKGDGERQTNWIAFEPEQIKSTLNRGEFSPENPDIRFMPAPTFFSKAERAVEGAKSGIFNKEGLATIDQAKALFVTDKKGQQEFKVPEAELEWSGVLDYLDLQKEQGNKVSKDDLLNYIKSNGVEIEEVMRGEGAEGPTLFKTSEKFTMLPGGENYSELVLKLPEGSLKGGESEYFDTPSGHRFPEDNILAHIRFTERIDADGKKMLFLEEVQSDWASEGRRSGFRKNRPAEVQEELDKLKAERDKIKESDAFKHLAHLNEKKNRTDQLKQIERDLASTSDNKFLNLALKDDLDLKIKELNDRISETKNKKYSDLYDNSEKLRQHAKDVKTRIEEIETEYADNLSGAPDMPYKGGKWEDLIMKRMIRYAADNGFDRLGWITGKDTADRYNLSKVVNQVTYNERTKTLIATDTEGKVVLLEENTPPEKISDYIGKEPAGKLLSLPFDKKPLSLPFGETKGYPGAADTTWRTLEGEDLNIGGEWAKNLYDKSLPSKAKKITKKKGAVGRTRLGGDTKKRQELADELKEVEEDIAINQDEIDLVFKFVESTKADLDKILQVELPEARFNEKLGKSKNEKLASPKELQQQAEDLMTKREKYRDDISRLEGKKYDLVEKRKRPIEAKIFKLDKAGSPEANYVDITPEVKEIAEEGFSYFMPAGRAGSGSAPMQTGSPQPPSAGVFMPKVKLTEEEKEESKRILEKL